MKLLLALLALALPVWSQVGIVCPSTSAKPLVCSVTTATIGATTYQWTISVNTPTTGMAVRALPPDKSASAYQGKMLLLGMNASFIRPGTIATVTISLPSTFTCPGNSPCVTVTLAAPQATISNHAVNLAASPGSAKVRIRP